MVKTKKKKSRGILLFTNTTTTMHEPLSNFVRGKRTHLQTTQTRIKASCSQTITTDVRLQLSNCICSCISIDLSALEKAVKYNIPPPSLLLVFQGKLSESVGSYHPSGDTREFNILLLALENFSEPVTPTNKHRLAFLWCV